MKKRTILKTLSISLLFFVIISVSGIVNAQNETDTPYNIEIFFSEQNPETKVFKIKAKVESQIDSSRNTLEWKLPSGLRTTGGDRELVGYYCQIKEGRNETCISSSEQKSDFDFTIEVIPYQALDDSIIFSIQSYIDDGEKSYKVTQVADIKVNSNLELEPVSANYRQLEQILNFKQLANTLTLGVFGLFILLMLLRRIYIYVNPPVKSTSPHNSKILEAYENIAKNGSMDTKKNK